MAKMCIICGNEVSSGKPVENTQVIEFIRKIKKKLNIASNNTLVVCESDLEEYKKRRKSFEKKIMMHVAGGALLVLLSVVLPLLAGSFQFVSFVLISLLALLIVGLAMLSYIPPLENKTGEHKHLVHKKEESNSKKHHAKKHGKKRE